MKKVVWFLIPLFVLIISLTANAQQEQPDPVFSLTEIYPGTWDTGPNPEVVFSGDKMLYFGGLKEVATAFKQKTGINVYLRGFGCKAGAEQLIAGKSTMAGQCRVQFAKFEMNKGLKRWDVARYALTVFVNPSNPVNNLTLEQLDKINKGEITNWKELGGKDEPIIVVEPAHCYCMHPQKPGQKGPELLRTGPGDWTGNRIKAYSQFVVVDLVKMLPNAISAEKSPYVDSGKVKIVAVNGIEPTKENILNGSYPVVRVLDLITRSDVDTNTLAFIDFVMSKEGQDILQSEAMVRLHE
jgi:phosphate transport system substrate-binding protein